MKAYIIHVSDAYDREAHMLNQIKNKGLESVFILDGDKNTLTKEIIDIFFKKKMATISNATSCAYKHILACKRIAEGDDSVGLILEDDIKFYNNFSVIEKMMNEIKTNNMKNFMISIEDSNLKYVRRSERVKNIFIYPKQKGRLAGAYLIDKEGAKSLLNYAKENRIGLPIDWFHNECVKEGILNIYWSHPPLAVQGSLDGSIKSLIDNKKHGYYRIISFKMQKIYKKVLYFLR